MCSISKHWYMDWIVTLDRASTGTHLLSSKHIEMAENSRFGRNTCEFFQYSEERHRMSLIHFLRSSRRYARSQGFHNDAVKLNLFRFFLQDKAKKWLQSFQQIASTLGLKCNKFSWMNTSPSERQVTQDRPSNPSCNHRERRSNASMRCFGCAHIMIYQSGTWSKFSMLDSCPTKRR